MWKTDKTLGLANHGHVDIEMRERGMDTTRTVAEEGSRKTRSSRVHISNTEEMEKYAAIFESMDMDANGFLSMSEIVTALEEHLPKGTGLTELESLFRKADTSKRGQLDFDDFVVLMACLDLRKRRDKADGVKVSSRGNVDKATAIFAYFDTDGNGRMSAHELHNLMRLMGSEKTVDECKRVITTINLFQLVGKDSLANYRHKFTQIDADRSGKISVDELCEELRDSSYILVGRDVEEAAKALIDAFDTDDDGELDFSGGS